VRQKARQKSRFKKALLTSAVGIGILLVPAAAWWAVRYYRVEIAIHSFVSNPSQAGTDKLIALLDRHIPTQDQGARILKVLLWPKVVTRSAYAVGREPTISTVLPFYLHFHTTLTRRVAVLAEGRSRPTAYFSTYLGAGPDGLFCPVAPDRPGKFAMEVRCHYLLAPSSEGSEFYFTNPLGRFLRPLLERIKVEPWLPPPEKKWYQVRFNVPVEIAVVNEAKAEQVQLLSYPELDALMRTAFSSSLLPKSPYDLRKFHVSARRLPANVAFRCYVELPDGAQKSSPRPEFQRLRAYAGRDFAIDFLIGDFIPDRPGTYDAKLVFEPDPNYAFEDATIKSIWNGTLEFPIHFTVAPEPNPSEQQDTLSSPPRPGRDPDAPSRPNARGAKNIRGAALSFRVAA
jgi:hypothetical protein